MSVTPKIVLLALGRIFEQNNPSQDNELDAWLDQSPGNRELLEEFPDPATVVRASIEYGEIDDAAAWDKLVEEIPSLEAVPKKQLFPLRPAPLRTRWSYHFSRRWLTAAALMIIIAGTALCFPKVFSSLFKHEKPMTVQHPSPNAGGEAGAGSYMQPGSYRLLITLPDETLLDVASIPKKDTCIFNDITVRREGRGTLIYRLIDRPDKKTFYNQLTTPPGGWYTVILPDGSKVCLNAASSIGFSSSFGKQERDVTLQGEAYFEVARQEGDHLFPFVVKITRGKGTVKTTAAGTLFNMTAYADETVVRTTLLKGTAHVEDTTAAVSEDLQAGDQYALNADGKSTILHHTDIVEAIAWKNDRFVFHDRMLIDIMRQIGRWYDATIVYQDTPRISLVTGGQRSQPVRILLQRMEVTGKVHFTIEDKRIIVTH